MIAILSLIIVLVVSLVIVRVATIALTLTGVSKQMARFQARSAFTGAGFTTDESEKIVGHPVRRRIIMLLMLLGNAGIVTAVSSLILSFTNVDEQAGLFGALWFRILVLAVCLTALLAFSHSQLVDRWMSILITRALKRWTKLDVRDYASLLHLTGDYIISELQVEEGDWLAGRTVVQLALNKEGVLILGVERPSGKFLGAPKGDTTLQAGDVLLLYGRGEAIEQLDERPAGATGNRQHVQAIDKHYTVQREESKEDELEPKAESAEATGPPTDAATADDRGKSKKAAGRPDAAGAPTRQRREP